MWNPEEEHGVLSHREGEEQHLQAAIQASIDSEMAWHQQQRQEAYARDLQLALCVEDSEQLAHETNLRQQAVLTAQEHSSTQEEQIGSWDCPHCTLRNPPFTPKCQACDQSAPDHVLAFQPIQQDWRFGVELELLIPQGKRDGLSLESIAKDLTRLGSKVKYCGYSHETTSYWKIVTDSSIRENQPKRDLTMELVSPILQGMEGLQSLRQVLTHVRRLGIATNKTCGFHVHVDASSSSSSRLSSLSSLKRLAQCFCAVENAFDLIVSNHSSTTNGRKANSHRFCRSNRLAFGERSNRQRWDQIQGVTSRKELVQWMNPNQDRYRKLNMTNLCRDDRPSTVEFRQHGGVEDVSRAEAWVRLVIRFCQAVATQDRSSSSNSLPRNCLLDEGASLRSEVRALFGLVGCPGLEQFFSMDRQLVDVRRGPLTNEWKCGQCHKVFATSRSLSQHCAACRHC